MNGQKLQRFIPRDVIALLNDEFDYRSVANWQPLTNLALALFTMVVQPDVAPTVGGGGTTNDLKWGRDPREDELDTVNQEMAKNLQFLSVTMTLRASATLQSRR